MDSATLMPERNENIWFDVLFTTDILVVVVSIKVYMTRVEHLVDSNWYLCFTVFVGFKLFEPYERLNLFVSLRIILLSPERKI